MIHATTFRLGMPLGIQEQDNSASHLMSAPKPVASRQAPRGGQENSGAALRFLESAPRPVASRQAPRGGQENSGAALRFLEKTKNRSVHTFREELQ